MTPSVDCNGVGAPSVEDLGVATGVGATGRGSRDRLDDGEMFGAGGGAGGSTGFEVGL